MIDEKKLIEQLKGYKSEWKLAEPFHEGIANGLRLAIEATEKQPKVCELIPCSERLPERDEWILIQFDDEDNTMCVGWYSKKYETFTSIDDRMPYFNNVVAWMPLPNPYEEKEKQND